MLGNLASVNKLLGRFDLTRAYQEEALALQRQVGSAGAVTVSYTHLDVYKRQLLAQLTSALDLTAHLRHVSERQRTLRGAVEWSYRLLDPQELSLIHI